MVAGREVTPGDVEATARLRAYWVHGEGAAKIQWEAPGAYDRCILELGKHVSPTIVHGLCANYAKAATGLSPGNDLYRVEHGGHMRGNRIGTG